MASRLSPNRKLLLDAARNVLVENTSTNKTTTSRRKLRCFPLQSHQVVHQLYTPSSFHHTLTHKIRTARSRVYLASLYIGPAAQPNNSIKERQLLEALQECRATDMKILMDAHRGLRPVRIPSHPRTTITSAHACWEALNNHDDDGGGTNAHIYLLSVLPPYLQTLLRNPYNEVAGVFHVKVYVLDNDLFLTGANLSEEYFTDRMDRYIHIQQSALVDCYANMVAALCRHAELYEEDTATRTEDRRVPSTSREELLEELVELLTTDETDVEDDCTVSDTNDDDDIVAYAVPTFQAPPGFFADNPIPSDTDVINGMIQTLGQSCTSQSSLRLASAYLNPTDSMCRALRQVPQIHLLTAGQHSHGFKPNPKKVGNKGKLWIPAAFDWIARHVAALLSKNASLWYYSRRDWTFHSKGLWMSDDSDDAGSSNNTRESSLPVTNANSLCVVTHGSGNYGVRSAVCDMESNLIFILPKEKESLGSSSNSNNTLSMLFLKEWNEMCKYAVPASKESPQELSPLYQFFLPIIRRFF